MFMEYERKQLLKSYYVFPFSIMMIEIQWRETLISFASFRSFSSNSSDAPVLVCVGISFWVFS